MQPLRLGKKENVTSTLVFNATGQDVTDVFVDGRQVVKDRKLLTADVEYIMKKVKKASDKITASL